jgi:acetylglutamate kinase
MAKVEVAPDPLEETIFKASVLVEALPYLQKFRDSRVVVKYGGSAMIQEQLKLGTARDLTMMESVGIDPIVVHGGGPEITAVMDRMGLEPVFHQGQRVTDEAALEIAEMVLAGKLNGEIVGRINNAGGRAVGLSGKDGPLVVAEKHRGDAERDMGFVGDVKRVNPQLLDLLVREGFIPVISPIGMGEDGQTYNINADFVAAEIAVATKARKLVLLTDVRGIMRDPKDVTTLIPTIRVDEIDGLIREGVIQGGMIPKVRAALRALEGGVRKAHILDGRVPHCLLLELFTDAGVGTEIVQ